MQINQQMFILSGRIENYLKHQYLIGKIGHMLFNVLKRNLVISKTKYSIQIMSHQQQLLVLWKKHNRQVHFFFNSKIIQFFSSFIELQHPGTTEKIASRSFIYTNNHNSHMNEAGISINYPGQNLNFINQNKSFLFFPNI